jgi:hypothetical protein
MVDPMLLILWPQTSATEDLCGAVFAGRAALLEAAGEGVETDGSCADKWGISTISTMNDDETHGNFSNMVVDFHIFPWSTERILTHWNFGK